MFLHGKLKRLLKYWKFIAKKEIDLQMGTTMSGPHRDHIKLQKDGKPFIPVFYRTKKIAFYFA